MACLGRERVKGLDVTNFAQGIYLQGGSGDVIQGDFVGTDTTGMNGGFGIGNVQGIVDDQSLSPIIGGVDPAARNIISGNVACGIILIGTAGTPFGGAIQGDYIGTDATGTQPLGDAYQGILLLDTSNILVGGTGHGAGNLISANGNCGILIGGYGSTGILIEGDLIGTDVTGTQRLGNALQGVGIVYSNFPNHPGSPSNNTVGGTVAAAGNVISGNGNNGVLIAFSNSNFVQGNKIGTDIAGSYAIPNSYDGVQVYGGGYNLVGGSTGQAGNLMSGNGFSGGSSFGGGSNNQFQGNLIGTDKSGEKAIPNGFNGLYISATPTSSAARTPRPATSSLGILAPAS